MSTLYKVNRLCKVNTDNPTPCKYSMDIAINIVPVRKNKKFENFVLGINDYQQCYEEFGTGCTLGDNFNEEKFVESIEVGVDVPEEICNKYLDDKFAVKINIRGEEPVYAWVYNYHNGYYCHSVYYTDNTLKVDCWEQSCL